MASVTVQVVYALPAGATILNVTVAQEATVVEVLQQSGILQQFPELVLETISVGIFSRKVALTDKVAAGDRIEIYRPLLIDPKTARTIRAKKAKIKGSAR